MFINGTTKVGELFTAHRAQLLINPQPTVIDCWVATPFSLMEQMLFTQEPSQANWDSIEIYIAFQANVI